MCFLEKSTVRDCALGYYPEILLTASCVFCHFRFVFVFFFKKKIAG